MRRLITKLYRIIKNYFINNEAKSLKCLKILDNTDYLAKNTRIKWLKYLVYVFIIGILMEAVLKIDKIIPSEFRNFFTFLLLLFVITVLVLLAYNFLILLISYLFKDVYHSYLKKSLKMRRLLAVLSFVKNFQLKLLVLMIVAAFIIGSVTINWILNEYSLESIADFIKYPFREYNLNCKLNGEVWLFWLTFFVVSIALCFSLYFVLQSQNIFELEDMESENRIILGILGVVTFIIGVDIDKVRRIGIVLLILVIQTAFFEFRQSQLLSKMYDKAQQIFQEQLLLDTPDYKKLKRCYYYGGDEYKRKMLSVEKFSIIIVENELIPLESLNDLGTYENYLLYKSFMYKIYLDLKN